MIVPVTANRTIPAHPRSIIPIVGERNLASVRFLGFLFTYGFDFFNFLLKIQYRALEAIVGYFQVVIANALVKIR
jgi:hypothetical protein